MKQIDYGTASDNEANTTFGKQLNDLETKMNEFTMTIDGQGVEGQQFFPVINPATGAEFAQAPDCTLAQLDLAMRIIWKYTTFN